MLKYIYKCLLIFKEIFEMFYYYLFNIIEIILRYVVYIYKLKYF